jgi:uncharacterized membrane protein
MSAAVKALLYSLTIAIFPAKVLVAPELFPIKSEPV